MSAVATESPTIQQAYEAAKAEHSASQNEPAASVASPESGTVKGPDEAKTEPPATEAVAPEISDFLSDDELSTLKAKHGTNADALAKDLKAAYTKKTQSLAEQRKAVEDLMEHADLVRALKSDGLNTLKTLAEQNGFVLQPKTATAQATETATAKTEAIASDMASKVKAALGPELDFLAEPLTRVLTDALKEQIGQAIEPLKQSTKAMEDKAAIEARDAVLTAFGQRHPDWKTHEKGMEALMAKIRPAEGMDPGEYLDLLYDVATKDVREAEAVKKHLAKMTAAAKADEGKSHNVADGQVAITRPANPSLRDAFEAAKRGERWE